MAQRKLSEPTVDKYGQDVHPAWGMISAHRGQYGPAGAVLFDSDIRHGETITVRLHRASRKREVSRDWIHPYDEIVEVEMSLAQWASFVSSMNTQGVPCTIRRTETEVFVDQAPYAPRLAESMADVHEAAMRTYDSVKAAFEKVREKPTKANIRDLEIALRNAVPNVDYSAKTLTEHAENVVQRARADVEAMVTTRAAQLGITEGDMPRLEIGAPNG